MENDIELQEWEILVKGEVADTAFFAASCDADYVKEMLVLDEGWPRAIKVRHAKKAELRLVVNNG